jgi:hypothetical protein
LGSRGEKSRLVFVSNTIPNLRSAINNKTAGGIRNATVSRGKFSKPKKRGNTPRNMPIIKGNMIEIKKIDKSRLSGDSRSIVLRHLISMTREIIVYAEGYNPTQI